MGAVCCIVLGECGVVGWRVEDRSDCKKRELKWNVTSLRRLGVVQGDRNCRVVAGRPVGRAQQKKRRRVGGAVGYRGFISWIGGSDWVC